MDAAVACTPPSVRFLGRKVYLGAMVILVMAMEHGLNARRRKQLIEQLDLYPQTLARWRRWWREIFPASRCWQANRGHFIPAWSKYTSRSAGLSLLTVRRRQVVRACAIGS